MHMIFGPLLFVAGLVLLHLSVHGAFKGRYLRLPKLSLQAGVAAKRRSRRAVASADLLVTDMLTEMLRLRQDIADLQSEVTSLRNGAGSSVA